MGQASGKEDAKEVLQATGTVFSVLVIISAILIIVSVDVFADLNPFNLLSCQLSHIGFLSTNL